MRLWHPSHMLGSVGLIFYNKSDLQIEVKSECKIKIRFYFHLQLMQGEKGNGINKVNSMDVLRRHVLVLIILWRYISFSNDLEICPEIRA